MTGERIAHFEIGEQLGQGGMGTVWKARDTRLHRTIALKLISPGRIQKADARHRFWQEAQSASALNHPNIVTIYEAGDDGDQSYIAMELIEGHTLDHYLSGRALDLPTALRLGVQIADAVSAAHSAGIIHRDLKPGNIMISRSGHVKVLDFGLAKLANTTVLKEDTTQTLAATEEGAILGTVSYMSPEQAQGKALDQRSDVFAFGSVLYEMITGRRAFQGENKISTLSEILTADPRPVSDFSPGIPAELERIIRRCLRKNPEHRFQHMADVKVALTEVQEESSGPAAPIAIASRSRFRWMTAGVAVLTAVAVAGWAILHRLGNDEPRTLHLRRLSAETATFDDPVFSPDGKFVVYASDRLNAGNLELWLHQLATGETLRLTNDPADDHCASFSPDGSRIVFRSDRDGGGLYVTSTLGGRPRLLAKDGKRPKFSPDGKWISYWTGNELTGDAREVGAHFVIPSGGGEPVPILTDVPYLLTTVWSPDSCCVIAAPVHAGEGTNPGDWIVAPVNGGKRQTIAVASALATAKLGHVLLNAWPSEETGLVLAGATTRDVTSPRNLWSLGVDLKTWTVTRPLRPLTFGSQNNDSAHALADGRVAFVARTSQMDMWALPMHTDEGTPAGDLQQITNNRESELEPAVTAGGKHAIYASIRGGSFDLFVRDMGTGAERALAASPSEQEMFARVSPDGSLVAYRFALRRAPFGTRIVPFTGGEPRTICTDCGYASSWLPSGTGLLMNTRTGTPDGGRNVVMLRYLDSGAKPELVLQHPKHSVWQARISPNGRWVTFLVNLGKANQIYVAPWLGGAPVPQETWSAVTSDSNVSDKPLWSPNGRWLYYVSDRDGFGCIYAQRMNPDTGKPLGDPRAIRHFHQTQQSLFRAGLSALGFTAARDKIVFNMLSSATDIWLLEP